MNRKEALANLKNEDPDYVVDVLRISSRELIRAFPSKVRAYLDEEADGDAATGEEEDGNTTSNW